MRKREHREKERERDNPEIEEEEGYPAREIDQLQNMGINAADIAKLKTAGINTVLGLLMTTRKELTAVKGINDAKVEKIMEAARKIEKVGFVTGC